MSEITTHKSTVILLAKLDEVEEELGRMHDPSAVGARWLFFARSFIRHAEHYIREYEDARHA